VPDDRPPSDQTGGAAAGDRAEEAAAAYALRRLLRRRGVRLALGAGRLLDRDLRGAREVVGPAAALLDQPGPARPPWSPWPHLRVASVGCCRALAALVACQQVTPGTWRTALSRDRPDVIVLADPTGWSGGDLRRLVAAARDDAIVLYRRELGDHLRSQLGSLDRLTCLAECAELAVDASRTNPVGVPHRPPAPLVSTAALLPRPEGIVLVTATSDGAAALEARALGSVGVEPLAGYGSERAHARRVLHLLAAGLPTIASSTPTLRTMLGDGPAAGLLTRDDELLDRAAELRDGRDREHLGVRVRNAVLSRWSVQAVLAASLQEAGLAPRPRTTSILLASRRAAHLPAALASVRAQTVAPLELVLVLHGIERPSDRLLEAVPGRVRTVHVPREQPLGRALDLGLAEATGDLVAKMDDDDLYGAAHLTDLTQALDYSGADIVGRESNVTYLEDADVTVHRDLDRQERWTSHLPGATMLVRGPVLRRVGWRHVPNAVDTELVRSIVALGGTVYSTHRFGFIRRRHGEHTYRASDRSFRRGERSVAGLDASALEL
jgi:hypothetical protein